MCVLDASGVFANSEMAARYVKCYGFDYDYTLANYSPAVLGTIYTLACTHLVQHLGYPEQLVTKCAYDPNFAIRGLHFDSQKGFLLKIDQFFKVQPGYSSQLVLCAHTLFCCGIQLV